MEQQKFSPKLQRYILAYRMLLDAFDEYQTEIMQIKQPNCRPEKRGETRNRILMRCSEEARQVFRLLPRQEGRYRGIRWMGWLTRVLEGLCLLGAVGCAAPLVYTRQMIWLLLALICLTCSRICSKLTALLRDALAWNILQNDYQPCRTVWSETQQQLLPQRLIPFAQPLTCSVDPDNCIRAKIQCSCGGEWFRVWRHPQQGYLKATCAECGREVVLFDEHLDARHADGNGQQYYSNALEMALCRSCRSEIHRVMLTVASDAQRTFFHADAADSEDSGYCILFRLFCAECGAPSGEGQYFWCREWDEEEQEETQ